MPTDIPGSSANSHQTVPTSITAAHLVAAVAILVALKLGEDFLAPLVATVFVSLALAPAVHGLSRTMPRSVAAALVVLAVAGAIGGTAYALTDQATRFSRRLPAVVREIRTAVVAAAPRQGAIRQLQQAVADLERSAGAAAAPADAARVIVVDPVDVQREMLGWGQSALSFLGRAVLLLFLVYFLLATGDQFKAKFVRLSSDRLSQRNVTAGVIDDMTAQIGKFAFYQLWSGALVGGITWACFAWLGVKYAGLWGVAAGVLNFVPYFGPTLVMGTSAVAALLQFHSAGMVILVAGVSVTVTSLEGMLLAPLMLGHAARVNSVVVFVALMFWGWLWGPLGLIVAVPVLMTIKTVADRVDSLSGLSQLLADR